MYSKKDVFIKRLEFKELDKKVRRTWMKEFKNGYKNPSFWACDFETTIAIPTQVYLATIENIETGEQHTFYNIEDFLTFFSTIPKACLWFHNGHKFDDYFTIYACEKYNIQYNQRRELFLKFLQPAFKVDARSGELLYDKEGNEIPIHNSIQIMDTRLILNASLNALANELGLSKYELEIDGQKVEVETPLVGQLEYNKDENGDYWTVHDSNNELLGEYTGDFKKALRDNYWEQYAVNDTHLLAEIIRQHGIIDDFHNNTFTAANKAWKQLLELNPTYAAWRELFRLKYGPKGSENKYYTRYSEFAREAYKGGIATGITGNTGYLIESAGLCLDYTSAYPHKYMNPDLYPLPEPIPMTEGEEEITDDTLYIIKFSHLDMTCKPGRFPLAKMRTDVKGKPLNSRRYVSSFTGPITFTKPEWEYMKENYYIHEFKIEECVYYKRHKYLENALKTFGEHWFKIKNDSNSGPVEVARAKLMLNSVSGYLGFWHREEDEYEFVYDPSNEDYPFKKVLKKNKSLLGLPVAEIPAISFITAYQRVRLANDMNKVGLHRVSGCDTDSMIISDITIEEARELFYVGDDKATIRENKSLGKPYYDSLLGELSIDKRFDKSIYLKAKTYALADKDNNIIKQATAGSNYKFKHLENFKSGQVIESRETVICDGGCVIRPVLKRLGEDED